MFAWNCVVAIPKTTFLICELIFDKTKSAHHTSTVSYAPKKYTHTKSPPWFTREIASMCKNKHKTWNKYYKDPTPEKWKDYTTQRNLLSHTIEKAKENYENKIASEIKHNPKQFWKYVSSKTKSKGKIVDLHNPDGNLVTDDREKAEILALQLYAANYWKK